MSRSDDFLLQLYYGELKVIKSRRTTSIIVIETDGGANWISVKDVAFISVNEDKARLTSTYDTYDKHLYDIYTLASFAERLYIRLSKEHGEKKFTQPDYYGWRLEWNLFLR
jgi:hypothetical protein